MKIDLLETTVRELTEGYSDDGVATWPRSVDKLGGLQT